MQSAMPRIRSDRLAQEADGCGDFAAPEQWLDKLYTEIEDRFFRQRDGRRRPLRA
jgi:hypothetical protein